MPGIFQKKAKKCLKKAKKGQNIWRIGQKYGKFENVLKKGRWLSMIIACNRLLEKALLLLILNIFDTLL